MDLSQAIYEVRLGLDEPDADFWSDAEITGWLNEGAQLMCSLAHLLRGAVSIPSVSNQQEYLLPDDCDEVESVGYDQGSMLNTVPVAQAMAQRGTRVGSTPVGFYVRQYTRQTMNHGGGSSLSEIDIDDIPNTSNPYKVKKVIGLWPVPNQTGKQIFVSYYQRHYTMDADEDEPAIPPEFQRGWIDFAVAKGKSKEQAYGESDKYMSSFRDYAQRCAEKWANDGQEVSFPRRQVQGLNRNLRGGSSWIYVGNVDE